MARKKTKGLRRAIDRVLGKLDWDLREEKASTLAHLAELKDLIAKIFDVLEIAGKGR